MAEIPAPPESGPLFQRQKQAQEIARSPRDYKICEGCQSIVRRATVLCPNCHSYRYELDPARVVQQAQELAKRPAQTVQSEDLLD